MWLEGFRVQGSGLALRVLADATILELAVERSSLSWFFDPGPTGVVDM